MAWLSFDAALARLQSLCTRLILRVLACGPIPQHIAFVMDGNRRWASGLGQKAQAGHGAGFESLKRVLEICLRLRVRCVTVYAFSIENFSRPKDEVDAIMELAKNGLLDLAEEGELLSEYGVRVNFLGRLDLLPEDVREAIAKLLDRTRDHDGAILNVCCPYTARDEITTAVQRAVASAQQEPTPARRRITSSAIEANLGSSLVKSPPLDILVRTSDVRRLSDFMLWQASSRTQLQFVKTLWPSFGFRDMLPILLSYQQKVYLAQTA